MSAPGRPAHHGDLTAVRAAAWAMLAEGARDPGSPCRHVTVATIAEDGAPTLRTVVLRGADPAAQTLRFHTDTRSHKYAELQRDPRAELHAYDRAAKVQIRARGTVALHTADATTAALWAQTPEPGKSAYRQPVAPGAPLATPGGAEGPLLSDEAGYRHFVAAILHVDALEWLYLADGGHRRARLTRHGDAWLAP